MRPPRRWPNGAMPMSPRAHYTSSFDSHILIVRRAGQSPSMEVFVGTAGRRARTVAPESPQTAQMGGGGGNGWVAGVAYPDRGGAPQILRHLPPQLRKSAQTRSGTGVFRSASGGQGPTPRPSTGLNALPRACQWIRDTTVYFRVERGVGCVACGCQGPGGPIPMGVPRPAALLLQNDAGPSRQRDLRCRPRPVASTLARSSMGPLTFAQQHAMFGCFRWRTGPTPPPTTFVPGFYQRIARSRSSGGDRSCSGVGGWGSGSCCRFGSLLLVVPSPAGPLPRLCPSTASPAARHHAPQATRPLAAPRAAAAQPQTNGSKFSSMAVTGMPTPKAFSTCGWMMPRMPTFWPFRNTSAWRPGKNAASSEGAVRYPSGCAADLGAHPNICRTWSISPWMLSRAELVEQYTAAARRSLRLPVSCATKVGRTASLC